MLDELETPLVRDGFTQTTLEMVALAATQDVERTRAEVPRRRRRRWLLTAAGLAAAGLAGFLAVMAMLPDPNRQLLEDLPVLENLDQYREVDTLDFLRRLADEKLFPENAVGDSNGNGDADSDAREEAEALAQRRNGSRT